MNLKRARQILKSLADDTRLRIVNLLRNRELAVSDICEVLRKKQPNISKHLTRLRLTGLVVDRRSGSNVYYFLDKSEDKEHTHFLDTVLKGLTDIEVFRKDEEVLSKLRKPKKTSLKKTVKK